MSYQAFQTVDQPLSDEVLMRLREWGEKTRPKDELLYEDERISPTIRVLYQDGMWCLEGDTTTTPGDEDR